MTHNPTHSESFVRFIIAMIFFSAILVIIAYGTYEAVNTKFDNEYLKLAGMIVAFVSDAVGVHVIVNAVNKRIEVGERFILSHSFGFHSCNADPTHCFVMNNKPMPICARHLGLYGGLFGIGMSVLTMTSYWITFTKIIPWNISLAIFFGLLAFVVAEGGLGKSGNIKSNNPIRCAGGVMSAFGWVFFAFFFIELFGIPL